MTFVAGSVTSEFVLNDAPGVAGFRNISKEAKAMKASTEASLQGAADAGSKSFKGMLKDINSEFGKKSNLGLGLKLLTGGGAIAGINLATNMFANYAGDLARVTDEYRRGDLSGREMVGSIARTLPVIGGAVRGWDELGEAFSGTRAQMDQMNEAAKKTNDDIDRWRQLEKAAKDASKSIKEAYRELREKAGIDSSSGAVKVFRQSMADARGTVTGLNAKFLAGAKEAGFDFQSPADFLAKRSSVDDQLKGNRAALAQHQQNVQRAQTRLDSMNEAITANPDNPGFTLDEMVGVQQVLAGAEDRTKSLQAAISDLANQKERLDKLAAGFQDLGKASRFAFGEAVKTSAMAAVDAVKGLGAKFPFNLLVSSERQKAISDARASAGANLAASLRTPGEEIAASLDATKSLFSSGNISRETFNRQLNGARQAILELTTPNLTPLQAEEFSGHGTVTSQDQGMAAIEKNTQATVEEIDKLLEELKRQGTSSPKFVVVSMGG